MKRIAVVLLMVCWIVGCSHIDNSAKDSSDSTVPVKPKKQMERPKMYSFEFAAIKEEWQQSDQQRFTLFYQKGTKTEKQLEKIIEEFNAECDYLADTFGPYPEKIRIYVHPSYDTGGYLGLAMAEKHVLHVGFEGSFTNDIQGTGTHELTHIFSSNWTNSHNIVLTEGTAKYFETKYMKQDLDALARLETSGKDVSVLTLYKIYTNQWDNDYGYSYNVAGSFVKYLIETYGMDKYEEMYKDKHLDFEVGFELVYNKKLGDVEKAWLNKIQNGK